MEESTVVLYDFFAAADPSFHSDALDRVSCRRAGVKLLGLVGKSSIAAVGASAAHS